GYCGLARVGHQRAGYVILWILQERNGGLPPPMRPVPAITTGTLPRRSLPLLAEPLGPRNLLRALPLRRALPRLRWLHRVAPALPEREDQRRRQVAVPASRPPRVHDAHAAARGGLAYHLAELLHEAVAKVQRVDEHAPLAEE